MNSGQAAQLRSQDSIGACSAEPLAAWVSWAAWAGIIGPVLFTAAFMAQEAFRRGEYDPFAQPVSALEAGPNGWIQQLNFVVFGLLTIVFAVGLHRGLRATRAGIAGPALFFVSGIALLLAAAFPLREDAVGVTYDPGGHVVSGFTFFLSNPLGLIVVSRRLARDTRWRSIASYTLLAGIVALVGFVVGGTLVVPDSAPLHDWAGLYQRLLMLAVIFPCRLVLSLRLLQVARGSEVSD
jgi:hypothetical membrane protein